MRQQQRRSGLVELQRHQPAGADIGVGRHRQRGVGDQALKEVNANDATVAFVKGGTLVAVAASSTPRDGASIEGDLESLARQIASQV